MNFVKYFRKLFYRTLSVAASVCKIFRIAFDVFASYGKTQFVSSLKRFVHDNGMFMLSNTHSTIYRKS